VLLDSSNKDGKFDSVDMQSAARVLKVGYQQQCVSV